MRVVVGALVTTAAWGTVVFLLNGHAPPPSYALVLPLFVVLGLVTWWATRGATPRRAVLLVVLAAAVSQVPGTTTRPLTSSDSYRYVWDGRVQLSGTSPYRYAPLDDRLAGLRDPVLFPGLSPSQSSGYLTEPVPTSRPALAKLAEGDPRTRINRPKVPTIYPPVAELWFTAVAAVTPWSAGTHGLQAGSALLAVAIAAALALWFRRRGRDPRLALWWAWCPTVLLEAGNGAHVDVLSAAFLTAAVVLPATTRGRRWLVGLLVGCAGAVKLFPLVMLPAFMPFTRARWRDALPAPVAALATVVASYLPHLVVAGALVLGYIPGYLLEESGPGRSSTLKLLLPDVLVNPVGALLLAGVAVWAIRGATRGTPPAVGAAALLGTFLLVSTPYYAWYAVSLVAVAVAARRWEWLAVAVAGEAAILGIKVSHLPSTGWVLASLVVVTASVLRWRSAGGSLPRIARVARIPMPQRR